MKHLKTGCKIFHWVSIDRFSPSQSTDSHFVHLSQILKKRAATLTRKLEIPRRRWSIRTGNDASTGSSVCPRFISKTRPPNGLDRGEAEFKDSEKTGPWFDFWCFFKAIEVSSEWKFNLKLNRDKVWWSMARVLESPLFIKYSDAENQMQLPIFNARSHPSQWSFLIILVFLSSTLQMNTQCLLGRYE